ncbi:MAG: hypothetical protein ACD_9C00116G0003 [uncultured bacterium]|nr:MAG: hypothetical protein ACD_9C00116G0003 [uncultured bacterium]
MSNQQKNFQAEALTQLIEDLNIGDLSQEKQKEITIRMTETLLRQIFVKTMDELGEQGREEYGKMSEGEIEPEQIETFFKEKIQDYDEMVQKTIEDFKLEMTKPQQ